MLLQWFVCTRLSYPHLTSSNATPFRHNVHHRGLCTEAAYGSEASSYGRLRRALLHLSYSTTISHLLDTITSIRLSQGLSPSSCRTCSADNDRARALPGPAHRSSHRVQCHAGKININFKGYVEVVGEDIQRDMSDDFGDISVAETLITK